MLCWPSTWNDMNGGWFGCAGGWLNLSIMLFAALLLMLVWEIYNDRH